MRRQYNRGMLNPENLLEPTITLVDNRGRDKGSILKETAQLLVMIGQYFVVDTCTIAPLV
jgi:hypothetical protein